MLSSEACCILVLISQVLHFRSHPKCSMSILSSVLHLSALFIITTPTLCRYYLEPLREARGWKVQPVLAAEQAAQQEMPDAMPSMDFKVSRVPAAHSCFCGVGGSTRWPLTAVSVAGESAGVGMRVVARGIHGLSGCVACSLKQP